MSIPMVRPGHVGTLLYMLVVGPVAMPKRPPFDPSPGYRLRDQQGVCYMVKGKQKKREARLGRRARSTGPGVLSHRSKARNGISVCPTGDISYYNRAGSDRVA
jgi:hypothetical protein